MSDLRNCTVITIATVFTVALVVSLWAAYKDEPSLTFCCSDDYPCPNSNKIKGSAINSVKYKDIEFRVKKEEHCEDLLIDDSDTINVHKVN